MSLSDVDFPPQQLSQKITVYPNPASSFIFFKASIGINLIELYSLDGIKIKSITDTTQMNIDELPNGAYFLQVDTDSGRVVKKILIHRD